jgi:hypothetical protein
MPVNFFEEACRAGPIAAAEFGICDNQDGGKAFIAYDNRHAWIARVDNRGKLELMFTAIDNCVEMFRGDGKMDKRCDGMLTSGDHIVFIELKSQGKQWVSAAVAQLKSTIRHFIENHDISVFKYKRAYACNNRHPRFHVIDHEMKQQFYREFKVRLNVQAVIKFN